MRNNALLFSRRQFRLDEAKMRNGFSLTSLMMLLMMFSQRCLDPPTDWGLFLKFQNSNLCVQREIILENVSIYGLKLKILLIKIRDCNSDLDTDRYKNNNDDEEEDVQGDRRPTKGNQIGKFPGEI